MTARDRHFAPFDTAVRDAGLPEAYLVNDFEDTLTELGPRVLLHCVEENDCRWPLWLPLESKTTCPTCHGTGEVAA